jgi:hypothetical protein
MLFSLTTVLMLSKRMLNFTNGVLVAGQNSQYFKENGSLNGTYYAGIFLKK